MALLTLAWSPGWGKGAFTGGVKAQCFSYLAPCLIHLVKSFCSYSEKAPRWASGGGIMKPGSCEPTRFRSSEASGLPGTMAKAPFVTFNGA